MLKLCQNKDMGFLVYMNSTEISTPNPLPPPVIQKVLERFELVFHMPVGLPPHHSHEHEITLHEGIASISVRPYRYPRTKGRDREISLRDVV